MEETIPSPLSPEQAASIHLPASLFTQIKDHTDVEVSVGIYETATLFPISSSSNSPRQAQVCSNVVTATVDQNESIQNLEESITIAFRLDNKVDVVR